MAKFTMPAITDDGDIIEVEANDIRIWELKRELAKTDHVCNKIVELFATETNLATIFSKAKEFKETIQQRQEWRKEINELEEESEE